MHVKDKSIRLLFSMTNGAQNTVSALRRFQQGALCFVGAFPTHGAGTGEPVVDPLASQGSIAVSPDGQRLFVVNAGDSTISAFRVGWERPVTLDVVRSQGVGPVSLAYFHGLLYVANRGDAQNPSNIAGFHVLGNGHLIPIRGAVYPLTQPDAQPSCLAFSPCGRYLVASERTTNRLDLYDVEPDGALSLLSVNQSSGAAPFGLTFTRDGLLLVAEAGPNALSSYVVEDGTLRAISASVPNGQQATCWVAATPDDAHAYTANAGTGNISHYDISPRGILSYVDSVPSIPAGTGAPIDCAVDPSGRFFYVLNGNQGSISAFRIDYEGHLTFLCLYRDICLPTVGAQGLALS
jgi:6-phosphogluconolactonase (cycloisomerase 2 family)